MDLYAAATSGDFAVVSKMLQTGFNVKASVGGEAVLLAARGVQSLGMGGKCRETHDGHLRCLKALLDAGAPTDTRDDDGETPLIYAATDAGPKYVQALLKAGADVHAIDSFGRTALMEAVVHGCDASVKALLAAGALVDDAVGRDALVSTALWDYARSEEGGPGPRRASLKKAKALLGAGAHPDHALATAAHRGDACLLRELLAAGATVDLKGETNATPLMMAARRETHYMRSLVEGASARRQARSSDSGHVKCAEALIAAGADVQVKDDDGVTPLMCAAGDDGDEMVKVLLAAGAEVDARDSLGRTALIVAVLESNPNGGVNVAALNALLAAGADVDAVDNAGESALMIARRLHRSDCIEALLAAGATASASVDAPRKKRGRR